MLVIYLSAFVTMWSLNWLSLPSDLLSFCVQDFACAINISWKSSFSFYTKLALYISLQSSVCSMGTGTYMYVECKNLLYSPILINELLIFASNSSTNFLNMHCENLAFACTSDKLFITITNLLTCIKHLIYTSLVEIIICKFTRIDLFLKFQWQLSSKAENLLNCIV